MNRIVTTKMLQKSDPILIFETNAWIVNCTSFCVYEEIASFKSFQYLIHSPEIHTPLASKVCPDKSTAESS